MRIIGLSGKKRHGKDTVANIIKIYSNRKVVTLSFAKPIKQALSIIHCISESHFDDESKESMLPCGKTPRQLAQWLGTDVYRNQFDNNIWLNNMESRIMRYAAEDVLIVITDCRFQNEIDFVRSLGGSVWKVDASMRVCCTDMHESERVSDDCDIFIDNNLGITQLENTVKIHIT